MSKHLPFSLLLCIFLFGKLTIAQFKTELVFNPNPSYNNIQDSSSLNLGAFYIENEYLIDLNIDDEWGIREYSHKTIKFTSEKGINEFSSISIDTSFKYNEITLKARVIKPDGTIKEIVKINPIRNFCKNSLNYSLKDLDIQVNDIVETIVYSKSRYNRISERLYLEKELFCNKSKLYITLEKNTIPSIKYYNNFKDPILSKGEKKGKDLITYLWESTNTHALKIENNSILYRHLPYMIFTTSLFRSGNSTFGSTADESWENLIDYYFTFNKHTGIDYKDMKNFIESRFGKIDPALSSDQKISIIAQVHNFIADSVDCTIREDYWNSPPLSTSIKKKRMSYSSQVKFYNVLFRILGIEKNFGIVLDKYSGNIDLTAPTSSSISAFLIKFKIDNLDYFITLKYQNSFGLNEIPFYVQGTYAVFITNIEDKTYIKQLIPFTDKSINTIKNKLIASIDQNSTLIPINGSSTFSGSPATKLREQLASENIKDFSSECSKKFIAEILLLPPIDSLKINQNKRNVPPYSSSLTFNLSVLSDSILDKVGNDQTIGMKNLIKNKIIKQPEGNRQSDFVFDYSYSDEQKIYLNFKQKVQSNDLNLLDMNFSNELGAYSCSAKQINENTILITSKYEIEVTELAKEKGHLITQLNDYYQKALSQRVKFKNLE